MASVTPPSHTSLPRKLAFVVTEDWFFVSHFLPMVRAARQAGLEPIVVTRVRRHAAIIEAAGARVVPLEAERRSLNPFAAASATLRMAAILRRERVDVVHCIAMRSILVGSLAASLAGVSRRVHAVTGGGYLGARRDAKGRLASAAIRKVVRRGFDTGATRYLFENNDDPAVFELNLTSPKVTILGGAGVDPSHFTPSPIAPAPPLRIALVSRMLWSKGIDLAVEAVRLARAEGHDIRLSLFGEPDASNPRAISRAVLEEWSASDGIEWNGFADDVRSVWAGHHVACLPSRGGEGLPRTLLEAAACGRAILTTDVPGCRSFVRNGIDGYVVERDDARALANAMGRLAEDPSAVARMGANARERVMDGYTEDDVVRRVTEVYRSLFA